MGLATGSNITSRTSKERKVLRKTDFTRKDREIVESDLLFVTSRPYFHPAAAVKASTARLHRGFMACDDSSFSPAIHQRQYFVLGSSYFGFKVLPMARYIKAHLNLNHFLVPKAAPFTFFLHHDYYTRRLTSSKIRAAWSSSLS